MRKTVGIICEYDPIHSGHIRQIKELRSKGDYTIICLMSGNSTQRGGFAVTDKYTRAKAALQSGVDLVLELPFPYSSASAEYFAAAGVCILSALGVDEINFGSETGDILALRQAAQTVASDEFTRKYREKMKSDRGIGSATAYAEIYRSLSGEELPNGSNDLLGISYLSAAIRSGIETEFTTVKRQGTDFSSETVCGEYPSASALRKMFADNEYSKAYGFMPKEAVCVYEQAKKDGIFPSDIKNIEKAILMFFRTADAAVLENCAEAGGGIARRLSELSASSTTLEELLSKAATKRYTASRLRRAMLFCLTGVTQTDLRTSPFYTMLLAANNRGRSFLSERKNCGIKIVTKPSDAPACRMKDLQYKLDSVYTLTLPNPKKADEYFRQNPNIFEND